jgi:hypothetical protein
MVDRLCAFCGKIVVQIPPGSEVREGQKIFHLDCYVLYKRRLPKP